MVLLYMRVPFGMPFAYVMGGFHLVCLNSVFVVKGFPWTMLWIVPLATLRHNELDFTANALSEVYSGVCVWNLHCRPSQVKHSHIPMQLLRMGHAWMHQLMDFGSHP